jgi:hypothetical protein
MANSHGHRVLGSHRQTILAQRLGTVTPDQKGFSADLFQVVRVTFDLPERSFETLFDVSISTLRRRGREQMPLDTIASERLDRIRDLSLGAQSL